MEIFRKTVSKEQRRAYLPSDRVVFSELKTIKMKPKKVANRYYELIRKKTLSYLDKEVISKNREKIDFTIWMDKNSKIGQNSLKPIDDKEKKFNYTYDRSILIWSLFSIFCSFLSLVLMTSLNHFVIITALLITPLNLYMINKRWRSVYIYKKTNRTLNNFKSIRNLAIDIAVVTKDAIYFSEYDGYDSKMICNKHKFNTIDYLQEDSCMTGERSIRAIGFNGDILFTLVDYTTDKDIDVLAELNKRISFSSSF